MKIVLFLMCTFITMLQTAEIRHMSPSWFDHLNDSQLRTYCMQQQKSSSSCIQFAQFIKQLTNAAMDKEEAFEKQVDIAKQFGEIIQAINKEMRNQAMQK